MIEWYILRYTSLGVWFVIPFSSSHEDTSRFLQFSWINLSVKSDSWALRQTTLRVHLVLSLISSLRAPSRKIPLTTIYIANYPNLNLPTFPGCSSLSHPRLRVTYVYMISEFKIYHAYLGLLFCLCQHSPLSACPIFPVRVLFLFLNIHYRIRFDEKVDSGDWKFLLAVFWTMFLVLQ